MSGYVYDGSKDDLGTIGVTGIFGMPGGGAQFTAAGPAHGFVASAAVPAQDVPAVARRLAEAMHEAAGLPAPIVLEPAGGVDSGTVDGHILGTTFEVSHHAGNVRMGFGQPAGQMLNASPEDARFIAGLIAQHAGAAEAEANEPDPAEVEVLAGILLAGPSLASAADIARRLLSAGVRLPETTPGSGGRS